MLWDYLIISFSLRFHWKQNFDELCINCSQRNNYEETLQQPRETKKAKFSSSKICGL